MSTVSRRTVARGAAWAVPVVAVGSAAPALAASASILVLSGDGCKLPGNSNSTYKGYAFALTATNPAPAPQTILINSVSLNGTDLGQVVFVDLDTCQVLGVDQITVPAGTTYQNLALLTQNAANSANGTLTVSFAIVGGGAGSAVASVDASPPVNGASCATFTAAEKACLAII